MIKNRRCSIGACFTYIVLLQHNTDYVVNSFKFACVMVTVVRNIGILPRKAEPKM